jgi:TolA-binding protein
MTTKSKPAQTSAQIQEQIDALSKQINSLIVRRRELKKQRDMLAQKEELELKAEFANAVMSVFGEGVKLHDFEDWLLQQDVNSLQERVSDNDGSASENSEQSADTNENEEGA